MFNPHYENIISARNEASNIYKPIIIIINIIYAAIRVVYQWKTWTFIPHILISILLWVLVFLSYQGIVEDHGSNASITSNKKRESLAGGLYLDLLGLVVLVQFSSALWSYKFYWLLCILPIWGVYLLINTFNNDKQKDNNNDVTSGDGLEGNLEEEEKKKERRRLRSTRRRQKRLWRILSYRNKQRVVII